MEGWMDGWIEEGREGWMDRGREGGSELGGRDEWMDG